MTEPEYRQDDRTVGYCPICGQTCTDTMMDGGGWCPDHGRVWVDWSPRTQTEPKTDDDPLAFDEGAECENAARELGEDGILPEPSATAGGSREGGASDPRPDPRTHPEYWTE